MDDAIAQAVTTGIQLVGGGGVGRNGALRRRRSGAIGGHGDVSRRGRGGGKDATSREPRHPDGGAGRGLRVDAAAAAGGGL